MNDEANPDSFIPVASKPGGSVVAAQIVPMVVLPIVIALGAIVANLAIIGLLSWPVLLGGWVACMRLALSGSQEPTRWSRQLGIALLVAIGLLWLVYVCVNVAYLAGAASARQGTGSTPGVVAWHLTAVGPALLVSWGQKLRAHLSLPAWARWLAYWFGYCLVSALAGAALARFGFGLGA